MYTSSLLSRKYDLYQWTEVKIASLVALNGFLITAYLQTIAKLGISPSLNTLFRTPHPQFAPSVIALVSLALFVISTLLCLWHVIPIMNSRSIPEHELKRVLGSVVGISRFSDHRELLHTLKTLSPDEILTAQVSQLWGMNRNILRNSTAVKLGVLSTGSGTILLAVLLMMT